MPDAQRILQQILQHPQQRLVVFDLDSTLYNVSPRTQKILEAFIHDPGMRTKFPMEIDRLRSVEVCYTDWGLKQAIIRAGVQGSDEFFKNLREWWKQHFFSNTFLNEDLPYAGAVDFVKALHQQKIPIMYLTGRNADRMRQGTLDSLSAHGFPLTRDEHLIMKPSKGFMEDELYKDMHMLELKKTAPHVWFFENEPLIIHQVRKSSPEIKIVFVNTTHSGQAHPPTDLPVISKYR